MSETTELVNLAANGQTKEDQARSRILQVESQFRRMKSIRIFAPPFNVTHELRGGDGDVPDLAPSHEYRVHRAVRLPKVDLEGVRRRREEALVGRVKR